MKLKTLKTLALAAIPAFGLITAGAAIAQDYPSQPIQLVIPYNPGGDSDLLGRIFASQLERVLESTVVPVNVAGASGSIATTKVYQADPDGYTMLFHHSGVLGSMLTKAIDFRFDDLTVLGSVGMSEGSIWVTSASSPYQNMEDLVEAAKANPGTVKNGINFGSQTHVHAAAFEEAAGVEMHNVDVGGIGEKIVSILGKHVDVSEVQVGAVQSYLESGDMRALGTPAAQRFSGLPDVATFQEQGIDVAMPDRLFWVALPPNAPADVVEKLQSALAELGESKELATEYAKVQMTPRFLSAQETADYLNNEFDFNSQYKDIFLSKK
ncbi:Bug family tripartite tricarboxylate transporter substrate binding protein [Hoeflea ulvae]|uniref:Tripartite tricarboxylate transporter substrate binding protein n=1 Tax=Hoeflea ulvae TaxID=2983764 RepID=A0ABT3YMC4_9HYPH|nr:tripartite tricarboxylate transporter substrate binding protein [Hoeflea ulvae]MCY0097027.1 tripartite tricarboxylate transporter substrate binding protein [Hoeflea ulvae]